MDHVCNSCGAPARPGVITCEFCENPVNPEAAKRAIGCRQCATLNVETAQQCLKCKAWLVVQCLFCNAVSRHDLPGCASCREPFAGAAERRAARDAEVRRQQMLQTVGAVAPIAGSLLGGVAGAFLGSSFGGNHSYSHGQHHAPQHHHNMGGSYDNESYRNESSVDESTSSMREAFASDDDDSQSRGERGESIIDSVAEAFSDDDDSNSRG